MNSQPFTNGPGIRWRLHFIVFTAMIGLYALALRYYSQALSDIEFINKYFNPISFIATLYALFLTLLQVKELGERSKLLSDQTSLVLNQSLKEGAKSEISLIKDLWKMAEMSIDGKNYPTGRLLALHARDRLAAFNAHPMLQETSKKEIETIFPQIGSIENAINDKLHKKRELDAVALSRMISDISFTIHRIKIVD